MPQSGDPVLTLATQIVIAHVKHNEIPGRALPGLIRDVYEALANAGTPGLAPAARIAARPTAEARGASAQSVFHDHLICKECGLHMKMLKRHLQTVHDITPAQYRAKWDLPGDYPMVARDYAALRSSLAKESGLGKRPVARAR